MSLNSWCICCGVAILLPETLLCGGRVSLFWACDESTGHEYILLRQMTPRGHVALETALVADHEAASYYFAA